MKEILWHGRGGQGAFTAAKLLGAAYSLNGGGYAVAFPSFGPERRGAPMRAFTKLSETPIGDRSEIRRADYCVYLDDTLFSPSSFAELKPGGKLLLNTRRTWEDDRVLAIDADGLAMEILKRPITNTILLGALAAVAEGLSLENVEAAIRGYMAPKLREKNLAAVRASYAAMKEAVR